MCVCVCVCLFVAQTQPRTAQHGRDIGQAQPRITPSTPGNNQDITNNHPRTARTLPRKGGGRAKKLPGVAGRRVWVGPGAFGGVPKWAGGAAYAANSTYVIRLCLHGSLSRWRNPKVRRPLGDFEKRIQYGPDTT